jgi:hypothetical protein
MVTAEDHHLLIRSKRKAISALLPHAIRQERGGQPEILDAYLCAVRTSMEPNFTWRHIGQYASELHEASSRAIVLVLPYIRWDSLTYKENLIQRWAAAASAVSYTEDGVVVRSVVNMLLQIASECKLLPHIPTETWSWLTKWPRPPPVDLGRRVGTCAHVVKAVRAFKDIEILKSYFLLTWSSWSPLGSSGRMSGCPLLHTTPDSILIHHLPDVPDDTLSSYLSGGLYEMWVSIREDFGGIGMGDHRTVLLQVLDRALQDLDFRMQYLRHYVPGFDESDPERMKYQYQTLRETVLETEIKAITRTSHLTIVPLHILTPAPYGHRIPCNIYVRTPSPVPVVSRLLQSVPPLPTLFGSLRPTRCVSFGHSSCHL